MDEKRLDQRIHNQVKVMYTSQESFGQEYIHNISLNGLFLETSEEFSIGQEITLSIPFSDLEKYVKIKGEIVRITDEGVGVHFIGK